MPRISGAATGSLCGFAQMHNRFEVDSRGQAAPARQRQLFDELLERQPDRPVRVIRTLVASGRRGLFESVRGIPELGCFEYRGRASKSVRKPLQCLEDASRMPVNTGQ